MSLHLRACTYVFLCLKLFMSLHFVMCLCTYLCVCAVTFVSELDYVCRIGFTVVSTMCPYSLLVSSSSVRMSVLVAMVTRNSLTCRIDGS